MPNWCENVIHIEGKGVSEINGILKKIKPKERNNNILFKILVGLPPGTDPEKYEKGGWYETNIAYWGTKWDISYNDVLFHFNKNSIKMTFLSAWSPPINFGKLLSAFYNVNVTMQYCESGLDFAGETKIMNGEIVKENDYAYNDGIKMLGWYE